MPIQLRRNIYDAGGNLVLATGCREQVQEVGHDNVGPYICVSEHPSVRIRPMLFEFYFWLQGRTVATIATCVLDLTNLI